MLVPWYVTFTGTIYWGLVMRSLMIGSSKGFVLKYSKPFIPCKFYLSVVGRKVRGEVVEGLCTLLKWATKWSIMQNQEHGFKHNKEAPPAPLCWWRVDGKFNLRVTVGDKRICFFHYIKRCRLQEKRSSLKKYNKMADEILLLERNYSWHHSPLYFYFSH